MPVFNAEKYLPESLKCVTEQTLTDIEIICVNDGSTDSSKEILEEFAANDPRIKIISQQNCGAGSARNRGMEIATGDYLSFLDADDIFNPDMLEKAYEKAEAESADIVIFQSLLLNQKTGEKKSADWALRMNMIPDGGVFKPEDISDHIFQFSNGWPWDKLFRKSFIEKNDLHFQNTHFFNDTYFVFSALAKAGKIAIVKEELACKRLNSGESQISLNRSRYWIDFEDVISKVRQSLQNDGAYDRFSRSFINYVVHICLVMLDTTDVQTNEHLVLFYKEYLYGKYELKNFDRNYFYNKKEYDRFQKIIEEETVVSKIISPEGFFKVEYYSSWEKSSDSAFSDYIPIILAADSNYARQMYVTLRSMLESKNRTSKYLVYLLVPERFSNSLENQFRSLAGSFSYCAIRFIVMGSVFADIQTTIKHITSPTYYRLLSPNIVPFEKCIYLDVDIIVRCDLNELYSIDIGDNFLAGVKAPVYICHPDGNKELCEATGLKDANQYVNAGVLVLNISRLSSPEIMDKMKEMAFHKYPSQDQDVLNIIAYDHIYFLDIKYNVMTKYDLNNYVRFNQLVKVFGLKNAVDAYNDPKIIHYADKRKPWKDPYSLFSGIWWDCCSRTPFFKEMWNEMPYAKKPPEQDLLKELIHDIKKKGPRYYIRYLAMEIRK